MGNLCCTADNSTFVNPPSGRLGTNKGIVVASLNRSMVKFKVSTFAILKKGEKFTDNYDVGAVLGEGAYGQVLESTHKASGQVRAVKVISKQNCTDEDREEFINETEMLKRLSHPNIITIYEMFEDEANFYLATELCKGGDLFEELLKGGQKGFSEARAAYIMKEILLAINHCHSENICHRDLKPENILLDSNNRIKLIDFGTAEAFEPSGGMKGLIGTPYYIAPEVLEDNKSYSEKCDIWSLGIIMYVILTGQAPFNGKTDIEIFNKIRGGKYPKTPLEKKKISNSGQDLISQMIILNPKKRITAQKALEHKWFSEFLKPGTMVQEQITESSEIVESLRNFKEGQKMQRIVLSYIVSQLTSKEELKHQEQLFRQLDTNGDGKLDRNELIKGFSSIYGEFTEMEVDKIMKAADLDGSGEIDISEWKTATSGLKKVLTKDRLRSAFDFFDKDRSGSISVGELKEALNAKEGLIDESIWDNIIKEADSDGNGDIDFNEFESMMTKLVENVSIPKKL